MLDRLDLADQTAAPTQVLQRDARRRTSTWRRPRRWTSARSTRRRCKELNVDRSVPRDEPERDAGVSVPSDQRRSTTTRRTTATRSWCASTCSARIARLLVAVENYHDADRRSDGGAVVEPPEHGYAAHGVDADQLGACRRCGGDTRGLRPVRARQVADGEPELPAVEHDHLGAGRRDVRGWSRASVRH